ncbi:DUF2849 domain-containing protein [Alsobacter sp. SYSU M60028]|uniref:DUF2849 domain-containing protein n=1 Tax=Alsobacter ponti TaxID=2962936 RepID=A0ABT1L720_9HYPH|nr:DUF2849 domain-containing protein [Alsobacter ponti]MCP8937247.1 DUF2849 domain-containing protein [Alsobacter ponti]
MMKKPRSATTLAVTGNDTRNGRAVFRTPTGAWSQDVSEAEVAESKEAGENLLARAEADARQTIVVDPYLIEVAAEGDRLVPTRLRELIRVSGPTIVEIGDAAALSRAA